MSPTMPPARSANSTAPAPGAVSYTHLDVYKRQLFYTRQFALPWLNGHGDGSMTNALLWPGYAAGWPSNGPAEIGGYFETVGAWGLPLLNTLILLTSGVTITVAHHALKSGKRGTLLLFLGLTMLLGCCLLYTSRCV